MSILAKLYIEDREINILKFNYSFNQKASITGLPSSKPTGGRFDIVFESTKDNLFFEWMVSNNSIKNLKIVLSPSSMSSKSRTIELIDTYCLKHQENFDGVNQQPMATYIQVSPAIMVQDGTKIFEWYWKVSDLDAMNQEETVLEEVTPNIININWINPETKEKLEETTYTESIALSLQIENPDGNSVTITITKEDGTEFENGKTELTFEEEINDDGLVEISAIEIKEQWEEFKTADIDKLIAKVNHNGHHKRSKTLTIAPTPKVLVSFRPNDSWKGEFGFDWIRNNDTPLFNDNKFDAIVSKQYKDAAHTDLEKDQNKYKGHYKKDATLLKNLKEKYKPFEVNWKKITDDTGNKVNDKHFTEWLSLKKGAEAKIKIAIDVTEKADYLKFDDNSNFTITPNKIDIKNKTGKKTLTDIVTIKSTSEFSGDQEIIIKSFKDKQEKGVLSGKINVWANTASNHKQKKVVFVQIKTPAISSPRKLKANAASEKSRINKYLNQAYIELHPDSKIVDIDLSTDPDFSRFVQSRKIKTASSLIPAAAAVPAVPATASKPAIAAIPAKPAIPPEALTDYLKKKLIALDSKYASFFKAFYFAENGYHPAGNLSGYSAKNADYVVVFKSANDQTASHEFLHSFSLPHTFTNSEATADAEFTYEAKKTDNLLDYSHNPGNNNNRCSLFYWQWIKANNSIS